MLLYYSLKLTFSSILEIFKILFYILFTFVLFSGLMFVVLPNYFDVFIHTKIFDSILVVWQGLFLELNIETMLSGLNGMISAFFEYNTFLDSNLYIFEFFLGIFTVIVIFIFFLYFFVAFRCSMNKVVKNYTNKTNEQSEEKLKDVFNSSFKSYNQMIKSSIMCLIFDVVMVLFLYSFATAIVSLSMPNFFQYFIFMMVTTLILAFRKMIFLGWDYLISVKKQNYTKAFLNNLNIIKKQPLTMFVNSFSITIISWVLIVIASKIFIFYFSVLFFAFVYLWSKSFGYIAQKFCNNESFFIKDKEYNIDKSMQKKSIIKEKSNIN